MQALTARTLKILQAGDSSPTAEHIKSSLARGLPEFQPAICFNDGTFVVVGSGPSVTSFLKDIKEERRNGRAICAVKGSHDWLIENGVEPDLFVSCEPRVRPFKVTSERTIYLLASRCPPEQFDQLKDRQVVLWHSSASKPDTVTPEGKMELDWNELGLLEECNEWKGHFGVGGGSTSGLRAILIGFFLGFRKFLLYGFDSCLADDKDTKRFTGETVGTAMKMDVICGGRRFWCNGALAQQATEFQKIYEGMPNITIEAKGDGLIAEILKQRRLRGYKS
jgi:hypothetical protein